MLTERLTRGWMLNLTVLWRGKKDAMYLLTSWSALTALSLVSSDGTYTSGDCVSCISTI